ncbi:MAG: hypothetical protein JKY15_01970 [Deltaproteobacteria bacterium]|nr:hypothetical protein [Deltaproteobacteria bacterium]
MQLEILLGKLELQLEFAEMRLGSAKIRVEEFADSIMIETVQETILESCKTVARAAGMKQGYLDAISFEKNGFLKGDVINDYSKPSKDALGSVVPLADYFEDGTVTHFIEPLDPDGVLAFPIQSGAITVTGFSKGHWVKGIRAMKIMSNGFKFGLERFLDVLTSKINRFLQENSIQ